MCFRKPWLKVKLVNFDFSAKSSSTDYNESNKPTPKSLAHTGSKKSLVELGVSKNKLFHFSHFLLYWKVNSPPLPSHGGVKLSSTDYNELNKPNQKSLAYISSKKSLFRFGILKNKLFHFFHVFHSTEKFNFSP